MRVKLVSVPVQDQQKALDFYTTILGFVKKVDVPMGDNHRWLTVVSAEDPEGPQILLEPAPNHFEPSKVYQAKLKEAGMPYTQFDVKNVQAEFDRLSGLGVAFSTPPTDMGPVKIAVFDDSCGNLIQMVEEK